MLTQEDDVEIHALRRKGWSKSAIARHTGRDRTTVATYLAGNGPSRERAPSCLEPYRGYLEARFVDDPHVRASVLFNEIVPLGSIARIRRWCVRSASWGCGRCVIAARPAA
jgi:transposase